MYILLSNMLRLGKSCRRMSYVQLLLLKSLFMHYTQKGMTVSPRTVKSQRSLSGSEPFLKS